MEFYGVVEEFDELENRSRRSNLRLINMPEKVVKIDHLTGKASVVVLLSSSLNWEGIDYYCVQESTLLQVKWNMNRLQTIMKYCWRSKGGIYLVYCH